MNRAAEGANPERKGPTQGSTAGTRNVGQLKRGQCSYTRGVWVCYNAEPTPLMMECNAGDLEMIRLLLECGASSTVRYPRGGGRRAHAPSGSDCPRPPKAARLLLGDGADMTSV